MTVTCSLPGTTVTAHDPNFWTGADFLGPDWTILDRAGDADNSEQQYYRPGNVTVVSGLLTVQAKVQSFGGLNYTSGMLQWTSRTFTHGSIEVRCQMPAGTGCWPAIWLLGAGCEATNPITPNNTGTCQWPNIANDSDELDFLEFLGGAASKPTNNFQTHSNLGDNGGSVSLGFNSAAAMHIYKLVRSASSLQFFADGSLLATISTSVSSTPMFLIMDVALGGTGGGTIVDGSLPQNMLVDYVRVVDLP